MGRGLNPYPQSAVFSDNELLIILLVKIAVITSMASLLLRWSFAKKLLLHEQRTIRQRLHLGLVFGLFFAGGSLVRHRLGYDAAELSLEGAFVTGLVGGYVPGAMAGALVSVPAVLMSPHEWLTFPLMIGVALCEAGFIKGRPDLEGACEAGRIPATRTQTFLDADPVNPGPDIDQDGAVAGCDANDNDSGVQ